MSKRAVDQLRHLLEVERAALLAGDLATVGTMITEKEQLTVRLEADNPLELRLLSAQLERNGALMSAARDGVEDVIATLRQQRAARSTLSTYDSDGKPNQISRSSSATVRRF